MSGLIPVHIYCGVRLLIAVQTEGFLRKQLQKNQPKISSPNQRELAQNELVQRRLAGGLLDSVV